MVIMSDTDRSISFEAEVIRVQTMESGAIRVILDLREYAIPQAAMLMTFKLDGAELKVKVTPVDGM